MIDYIGRANIHENANRLRMQTRCERIQLQKGDDGNKYTLTLSNLKCDDCTPDVLASSTAIESDFDIVVFCNPLERSQCVFDPDVLSDQKSKCDEAANGLAPGKFRRCVATLVQGDLNQGYLNGGVNRGTAMDTDEIPILEVFLHTKKRAHYR